MPRATTAPSVLALPAVEHYSRSRSAASSQANPNECSNLKSLPLADLLTCKSIAKVCAQVSITWIFKITVPAASCPAMAQLTLPVCQAGEEGQGMPW